MPEFQYHPSIFDTFPDTIGGIILASGIVNAPTPDGLQEVYTAEQHATLARIGEKPLSQIESLSAWRGAFRKFDVDPTKYRSAAEALLRRLTKKGDIPNINLLVDIGNLASIRYALPVAVCDTSALQGAVTVHFSDGAERYTPLGKQEIIHPEKGEVVFTDETGQVVARRWCWRQSDESAAREATTDAIITVEAHHAKGREDVQAALDDLLDLLREYAGGSYTSAILDANTPSISS